MRAPLTRVVALFALAAGLFAVAFFLWPRSLSNSLAPQAMQVMRDLLAGEGESYCSYVSEEELERNGISRTQCASIVKTFLARPLRDSKIVEGPLIEHDQTVSGSRQSIAMVEVARNHQTVRVSVNLMGAGGSPVLFFNDAVFKALELEGAARLPASNQTGTGFCTVAAARLLAAEEMSRELMEAGLKEMVMPNAVGPGFETFPMSDLAHEMAVSAGKHCDAATIAMLRNQGHEVIVPTLTVHE